MTSFGITSLKFLPIPLIFGIITAVSADFLHEHFPASVIEDSQLDTPGLLKKYKYPAETHYVTTEDNYILCMHRIPNKGKKPVFLMHGLMDSSSTWITHGTWNALGYYLYDLGYDVWMGNARGNRYSRNHTRMDPNVNAKFWDFSWHEIGYYDLPAMIDYTLKETGFEKVTYVGHSQGTTSFFVLCSTRKKYNTKFSSMHAIAPVAFMSHMKINFLALIKLFVDYNQDLMLEFLPYNPSSNSICLRSQRLLVLCKGIFFQIVGKEVHETNNTMWPVVFRHIPAGCAGKQIRHYLQLYKSERFAQFDYGIKENWKRYGKPKPPKYILKHVTAPVALYYAQNDKLAGVQDVRMLSLSLSNVIDNFMLPNKNWNHVTALWGDSARRVVFKHMAKTIKKYA